jgi:predicted RNA-binding protein
MTTHVFIVDINTFKYHLEYLFAGTGAQDLYIDFNNNSNSSLNYAIENNLVSMISDSQRIRKGDYIIFYLQQNRAKKVYEGKFYGIFKAKDNHSFLDNNDKNQFLKQQLNKSLTFRTMIEPYKVYPIGVTEWEALDEIKYIQSPNQMLWSLIYRKLRANRGNTMITIYESERLIKLIKDKNNSKTLNCNNLTFDTDKQEIIADNAKYNYTGRKENVNILPRLINKFSQGKSFEPHLQAYIVQNIGIKTHNNLENLLVNNYDIEWIGNEVYCGVGMQKIDIMLSLIKEDERIIEPIELKSVCATPDIIFQIQRYIDWIEQYYIPNRISDIQPVIISKKISNKQSSNYAQLINNLKNLNSKNNILPLKYIEFDINNNNINFQQIIY